MKFVQRAKASIFERARHYVATRQYEQLAESLSLSPQINSDLKTLAVLASIRAYLSNPVDLLIDVGAHVGNFADAGKEVLGANEVICFEPNEAVFQRLNNRFRLNPTFHCRSVALGADPGRASFHIHDDSTMSSLKGASVDALRRDFSTYDIEALQDVDVEVSTLDLELKQYPADGRRFFLKLDVQGGELDVLKGGSQCLRDCDGVLIEHMFTSPYRGAPTFEQICDFFRERRMVCAAALDVHRKSTHRISAVDFLFLPESNASAAALGE